MFAAQGWQIVEDRRQAEGAAGDPTLPQQGRWLLRELAGQVARRSRSTCHGANTQQQDRHAARLATSANVSVTGRPRISSSGTCARPTIASRRLGAEVTNRCEKEVRSSSTCFCSAGAGRPNPCKSRPPLRCQSERQDGCNWVGIYYMSAQIQRF